jgi:BirA family biotin operon repressor/biotin-[acetyl-CoA-carboxylase] ligase
VAGPLVHGILEFARAGFAPLVARYEQRDVLHGRFIEISAGPISGGVAEGVDATGALRVRADGLVRLVSGEVSVRAMPGSDSGPAASPPPDA